MRDRMWGHFAYLNQQNSVAAPPAGSFLDGTPFNTKLFNYTGKGTYQLNQTNKFIGYLQHGTKQQPNRTDINTRRRAGPHHRRLDGAAGLAELGLQGRMERHASARTCSPSSAPASSATTSASISNTDRHPLRVADDATRCSAAAATG